MHINLSKLYHEQMLTLTNAVHAPKSRLDKIPTLFFCVQNALFGDSCELLPGTSASDFLHPHNPYIRTPPVRLMLSSDSGAWSNHFEFRHDQAA